jgi:hypothetical protein
MNREQRGRPQGATLRGHCRLARCLVSRITHLIIRLPPPPRRFPTTSRRQLDHYSTRYSTARDPQLRHLGAGGDPVRPAVVAVERASVRFAVGHTVPDDPSAYRSEQPIAQGRLAFPARVPTVARGLRPAGSRRRRPAARRRVDIGDVRRGEVRLHAVGLRRVAAVGAQADRRGLAFPPRGSAAARRDELGRRRELTALA